MIQSLVFILLGALGCFVLLSLLVILVNYQDRRAYHKGNKTIKVKGNNPYKGANGGVYGSRFRDEYGRTDRWKDRYLRYGKRRWKEK